MPISSVADVYQKIARGEQFKRAFLTSSPASTTAAALASGGISFQITGASIGTTYPTTIQGIQIPSTGAEMFSIITCFAIGGRCWIPAWFYRVGTIDLANAATPPYDGFTSDSWTRPLLRRVMGQANQPIWGFPLIYLTTATATTAPTFQLRTTAGGAGYVDEAGNAVIGSKTFTFPAAATAQQSAFLLRLEDGDHGVRDITQVSVTTKGTAGVAEVYIVELFAPVVPVGNTAGYVDQFAGGLSMQDMKPAVPTSGSFTKSFFALLSTGATVGNTPIGFMTGVLNT